MFNSVVLDVTIGLVFIFLLYSLLASLIQEIIATALAFRARILVKSLSRMLQDEEALSSFQARAKSWAQVLFNQKVIKNQSLTDLFYRHPLLKYLGEDQWFSKPAYLTAKNFSKVIIDVLRGTAKAGDDFRPFIENVLKTGQVNFNNIDFTIDAGTLKYLNTLWVDASGDVQRFTLQLENWFDETQVRSTGWYKQYTQVILLFVGLAIAIVFNVDTFHIVEKLSKDDNLRAQMVQQAGNYIKEHPDLKAEIEARQQRIHDSLKYNSTKKDSLQKESRYLDSVSKAYEERLRASLKKADSLVNTDIAKVNQLLGLGWTNTCEANNTTCGCFCFYVPKNFTATTPIGWLITAIAISLGAPFWFDLLNKLFKLRGNTNTDIKKEEKEKAATNTPPINPKG